MISYYIMPSSKNKRLLYYKEKIRHALEENINSMTIGRSYRYVGTFAHKMKYVTDIDISNFVSSNKCESFEHYIFTNVQNIV